MRNFNRKIMYRALNPIMISNLQKVSSYSGSCLMFIRNLPRLWGTKERMLKWTTFQEYLTIMKIK